jgi:hypothetical protein
VPAGRKHHLCGAAAKGSSDQTSRSATASTNPRTGRSRMTWEMAFTRRRGGTAPACGRAACRTRSRTASAARRRGSARCSGGGTRRDRRSGPAVSVRWLGSEARYSAVSVFRVAAPAARRGSSLGGNGRQVFRRTKSSVDLETNSSRLFGKLTWSCRISRYATAVPR